MDVASYASMLKTAPAIDRFTGGIFDTNCFFLPEYGLLIDAPQDAEGWLETRGYRVETLLLTHAHVDHVSDAAAISRRHGCKVVGHEWTATVLREGRATPEVGFTFSVESLDGVQVIGETDSFISGEGAFECEWQVLYVPGHCPGSLCFFHKARRIVFGGDVLFAGGIGNTAFPGCDSQLLLQGIHEKLLPLGDDVVLHPGHGSSTTLGRERTTNPYLR